MLSMGYLARQEQHLQLFALLLAVRLVLLLAPKLVLDALQNSIQGFRRRCYCQAQSGCCNATSGPGKSTC